MSKTKERIRDSQLRYKQGLGQNFIYDEDLLAQLASLSGISEEDDILEVGPGSGGLTQQLCKRAHHVLSVELDERLIPLLNAFMAPYSNFRLVQGDVLNLDLAKLTEGLNKPFSVVANIPYYITTPLIQKLLRSGLPLKRLALMVQKEVAEKILSSPGDDAWCMLSVLCQYLCEPYLALDVPASCFTPVPKVDSAFVVLPLRSSPAAEVQNEALFFRTAAAAFAHRRKTMLNNLCAAFGIDRETGEEILNQAGQDTRIRGEKLTLEELARIADLLTEKGIA